MTHSNTVAERFGNFCIINLKVLTVHPVFRKLLPSNTLTLSDFAVVMSRHVVDAAGMNIDLFTKGSKGHGGTFNVPTREACAKTALPTQLTFFPDSEVSRMVFFGIDFHSHSIAEFINLDITQAAIGRKFFNIKIGAIGSFVNIAFIIKGLD